MGKVSEGEVPCVIFVSFYVLMLTVNLALAERRRVSLKHGALAAANTSAAQADEGETTDRAPHPSEPLQPSLLPPPASPQSLPLTQSAPSAHRDDSDAPPSLPTAALSHIPGPSTTIDASNSCSSDASISSLLHPTVDLNAPFASEELERYFNAMEQRELVGYLAFDCTDCLSY